MRVLLAIKGMHDGAMRVDALYGVVNLETDQLDVVGHVLELDLGRLVKAFACDRQLLLPGDGPTGTTLIGAQHLRVEPPLPTLGSQ